MPPQSPFPVPVEPMPIRLAAVHFFVISAPGQYIPLYEQKFLRPLVLAVTDAESIKVRILNGSDIPGLARKMRNVLTKEGLTVVEFGTSPYSVIDKTVIINQKGNLNSALKVSSILGIDAMYHIVDSSQLADVLVIAGKDYSQ